MQDVTSKITAVFARAFTVPGFDEALPAGEYEIETELSVPPNHLKPQEWKASVLVHLHPRDSHPGLARTLTVSLADLEAAQARDKLTGLELSQLFLDEMLKDPMVRLVMRADGVSEAQVRHLHAGARWLDAKDSGPDQVPAGRAPPEDNGDSLSIQIAENEGMPDPGLRAIERTSARFSHFFR